MGSARTAEGSSKYAIRPDVLRAARLRSAHFFKPGTRPGRPISCNIFARADELVRELDLSAGIEGGSIARSIRGGLTVGL